MLFVSGRLKSWSRGLRRHLAQVPRAAVELDEKIRTGIYPLESVPCAVCGGSSFDSLSDTDRHHVQSAVKVCRDCGLVQTNPRPTMSAYAQYYAGEYSGLEYDQEMPDETFFQSQRDRGLEIVGYLRRNARLPPARARVLEVGCNSGGILDVFRSEGYEVKGVDLNARFTQYGREQHGLDLHFGTVQDVDAGWRPSLIIYSHTLEHVTSPAVELQAVKRLLGDSGQLYVQVPGIKNLRDGYAMDLRAYIQFAHTYHFSRTSLTNLLRVNGFRFVCGDETVNGVFEPAEPDDRVESDYDAVMAYLRRAERERVFLRATRIMNRAYEIARTGVSAVMRR